MAHYAFLDENNIVTQVIVGRNEDDIVDGVSSWEDHYAQTYGQTCKRTSYNSIGGKRKDPETNEITDQLGFRKNYAGIGYLYNESLDAFIPPKPFSSWILNEETCLWDAPILMPNDEKLYRWDEDTTSWVELLNE